MQTEESPKFRCLLLEDDPQCSSVCEILLSLEGAAVDLAETVAEATRLVQSNSYDLFILDHNLPDGSGGKFFQYLKAKLTNVTAIVLTGVPELSSALELTRNGLFGYITKPFSSDDFLECVRRAVSRMPIFQPAFDEEAMVGTSRPMREVTMMIQAAGINKEATVLILGETGVGKDLCARLIHKASFASSSESHPYVNLNCATVPAEMFEAEIFGAEKGAYTGAHQARTGLAEAADGGTLFLDEIAEVPLLQQSKLLQLLETRQYRRLGSSFTKTFRGRIIAATNKSLVDEVARGTFRADLYFRLDVLSFQVPPLRERKDDLPLLAEYLIKRLCEKYKRPLLLLRPEDLGLLQEYHFPGNIRELRNILERSLLKTPEHTSWLQLDKARFATGSPPPIQNEIQVARPSSPTPEITPSRSLKETEYLLLKEALLAEKGAIRKAAARLGMSHQALLRRLDKWPELRQAAGAHTAV